jgi:tetratricopeptide (TPR) repeat protein
MKDLGHTLRELLGRQLGEEGYDVVAVPIPAHGDRMVRIRTLEEALDEFDMAEGGETIGYLLQVRAKQAQPGSGPAAPAGAVAAPLAAEPARSASDEAESIFARLVDETFAQAQGPRRDPAPDDTSVKPRMDGIYFPNGKLNAPFLLRNGELLFQAGDYPLARNIFKTLLQAGEGSGVALRWIARCYEAEGKLDEAQNHYEESITYHPALETYQSLAALLIRRRKDQEAAEVLERAAAIKDLPAKTRLELYKACGNSWLRAGKTDRAERHYRAALELDPTADSVQANLGALCLRAGKIAEARRCFQDALAANPRNDKAHAGLGSCHLAEGEKRQAHDCFSRALDLQLNNPTAIFHLVKCAYDIKSYATAARIVGEYVQIAPVNANLLYSLAGLQFHLGRMREAGATVRKILELQPGHAGASELQKLIERYAGA